MWFLETRIGGRYYLLRERQRNRDNNERIKDKERLE